MTMHEQSAGVVLLCTGQGTIQQVVQDDLGLTGPDTVGKSFASLVDSGSGEKAENFLATLAERGIAFDWELNVSLGSRLVTLHFFGGVAHVYWLIVGAFSRSDATVYYDEMMLMNNEQTNSLRLALKDVARLEQRAQVTAIPGQYLNV
jgi:hypothetical protein